MSDVFEKAGPERLVAGGTWFLLLMILSGIFALLWGIILSRIYGPVVFGIFSTAYAMNHFVWVILFGGLSQGLIKFGSEYVAKRSGKSLDFFKESVLYMTLLGIVACVIISYIAMQFSDPVMRIMISSVAAAMLFSGTKDALASILGSFQKNDYLSVVNSLKNISIFAIGCVFVLLSVSSYMVSTLIVIGVLSELIICLYYFRTYIRNTAIFKERKIFEGEGDIGVEKIADFMSVAKFGIFISIGMIAFDVMKSLDIIVLKTFFDYAQVGVYSIADGISSVLFYMTPFSLPVIPAIAEAFLNKDTELMKKYARIAVRYPLIIGVGLTVLVFMLTEPLVLNVYGEAFEGAIIPLKILIFGTLMLMFGYTTSSMFIGIGKSKLAGGLMCVAAVQYISSLYILVPMYGFNGAALSLTLTGITMIVLVPYFIRKELKVNVYEDIHMVLLSAVFMMLVLQIVPKDNVLLILAGVLGSSILFLYSLYYFEYVNDDDVAMLKVSTGTFGSKAKGTVVWARNKISKLIR